MNFESFFATLVIIVGCMIANGIFFYFKGHKDGVQETLGDRLRYITILKDLLKESEDTDDTQ